MNARTRTGAVGTSRASRSRPSRSAVSSPKLMLGRRRNDSRRVGRKNAQPGAEGKRERERDDVPECPRSDVRATAANRGRLDEKSRRRPSGEDGGRGDRPEHAARKAPGLVARARASASGSTPAASPPPARLPATVTNVRTAPAAATAIPARNGARGATPTSRTRVQTSASLASRRARARDRRRRAGSQAPRSTAFHPSSRQAREAGQASRRRARTHPRTRRLLGGDTELTTKTPLSALGTGWRRTTRRRTRAGMATTSPPPSRRTIRSLAGTNDSVKRTTIASGAPASRDPWFGRHKEDVRASSFRLGERAGRDDRRRSECDGAKACEAAHCLLRGYSRLACSRLSSSPRSSSASSLARS